VESQEIWTEINPKSAITARMSVEVRFGSRHGNEGEKDILGSDPEPEIDASVPVGVEARFRCRDENGGVTVSKGDGLGHLYGECCGLGGHESGTRIRIIVEKRFEI
jgi:hypothetical protein